jgi:hypothetical protein
MKSRSGEAVPSGAGTEGAGEHAQAGLGTSPPVPVADGPPFPAGPQAAPADVPAAPVAAAGGPPRTVRSPAAAGQSSVADQRAGAAPAGNGLPAASGGRAGTLPPAAGQRDGRARALHPPGTGRASQPSWATVLVTTVRLWAQRRRQRRGKQPAARQPAPSQAASGQPAARQPAARQPAAKRPPSRRRAITVVAVLAVAAVAAVATVVVVSRNSSPGAPGRRTTAKQHRSSPARPTATPAAVAAAAATARNSAATWVAQQINRSAVVACDPAMCAALAAKGVPATRMHVLPPGRASMTGADIVVATPGVRSALGTSLAGEDAPVAVAHFGTGAARIDVRVVAPDGAAGYRGAMAADVISRQKAGARLLHDHRIRLSATGRAQIHAGEIDPRLLAALAGLARRRPIHVIEFTATPGAAPGPEIPMRLAEIQGMGRFGGTPATIRALRRRLSGVRPPYHPAVLVTLRLAPHRLALRIGYRAPTPLGLLGPKGTLPRRA